MKYYLFQETADKMEDKLFRALQQIEPTVKELTLEEYENYRGFKQTGAGDKRNKNVRQPVAAATKAQAGAQVSGESLKTEIIDCLIERGCTIPINKLKQKNKRQLLELL